MTCLRRHLLRLCLVLLALASALTAHSAIVYVAAASGRNDALPTNGTAGALTIPKPAGTTAGMTLIASIAARPRSMTVTVPPGWVQMTFTNQTAGGTSTTPGGMTLVTYYKVATTSEPNSYTWTFANPSNDGGSAVGGILSFNGVDTSSGNPIDQWAAQTTPSGTTHTAPSITTTGAGEMIVSSISYLSAGNFGAPINTGGLTFTERLDQSAPLAATAVGTTLQMSTAPQAAAGATGTTRATANGNSDTGVAHQMALKVTQIDPSLAMTRSAPLNPGGTSSYTLTVTNLGVVAEPGPLTIVNTLPGNVNYTGFSGAGWSCSYTAPTVTCTRTGALAAGASAPALVLNVSVGAAATGVLINTATVSGTGGDGNTANNTATDTYIIPTQAYAYYTLDETSWGTILDSSGNGRNATGPLGTAAPTSNPVPAIGNAIPGNPGTCGAARIPATTGNGINTGISVNTMGNTAGTIMLWYASNTVWNDGNSRLLLDASNNLGNNAADRHFFLAKDAAGRLVFSVKDNAGNTVTATTAAGYGFAAGTWHHIAVSWGSTAPNNQLAIYLDGDPTPVATATFSGPLGTLSTLYVGTQRMANVGGTPAAYTSNGANGFVDEVRLYANRLDPLEIAQLADATHACVAVDHYELSVPSTGVSCLASTVTITACADTSSPCTNPATSVNGATATLAASAGTLGTTTLTFGSGGTATTSFSHPAAANGAIATITLSNESSTATGARQCCANGTSCSAANSCSITVNTAGFIVATTANGASASIANQVAGTSSATYYLRAVRTNTSTQACEAALTSGSTVGFGYECNNPNTCSGSNLMAINGTASTVISRNDNGAISASAGTYTDVALNFDANGSAPFTFNYSDAGQVRLWARKAAGGALLTNLAGSSNAFVVKPASLQITGASSALSASNPGSTTVGGSVFAAAGEPFAVTVRGLTSGNAVTPNFGNETTTPAVTFVNAGNVAGNIFSLVVPTANTPSNGVLSTGTSTSGNGGAVTGTVAVTGNRWSEVGAFTLRPSLSDYLGAGAVTGVQSGTIGRFRPFQYAVNGSLTACTLNTFAYAGRPLSGTLTVTAQNSAGTTTTNYGKGTVSLATLAANQLVFGNVASGLAVDSASTLYSLSYVTNQDFNTRANGTAQISAAVPVRMTSSPVAPIPSGLALTATSDEVATVSAAPTSVLPVATVPFRAGRLRLLNAYGSELLPLRVPVRAEYYNSSGVWQLNTDDNCTSIPLSAVAGAPAGTTVGSMSGGVATITLPAQAAGVRDIALNLGSTTADNSCQTGLPASTGANMPWMQFAWCSGKTDPNARVRFGSPRAPFIYLRERY